MKMINELSQAENDSTVGASAARSRGLVITFRYVPHADAWSFIIPPARAGSLLRSVKVCEA